MAKKIRFTPTAEKKIRNQEICMEIATGSAKDDVCKRWGISLTQLNRILREEEEEASKWFKSLPQKIMAQIFRNISSDVFLEIRKLERIRDKVKNNPRLEFELTAKIISVKSNYMKMIQEGPSLIRQKQIIEEAEELLGSHSK